MKVLVAFLLCASVPTARAALSLECGLLDQLAPIPFGEGPYDPEVGKPDRIRTTKDSDAYIIATSPETIDTTIVRYVPKDPAKPSTITKVYSDIYKFAIEAAGYRLLETLYEGEPKAGAFSVMKISFASVPNFVFMPDVRGLAIRRSFD